MDSLHQQLLLLVSLPIYALFIPLEILLSNLQRRRYYTLRETLMNIYLNAVNTGIDLLCRAMALIVLAAFFQYQLNIKWHPIAYWVVLFLAEDFLFWLEHFVDHKVRLFWAVHVTHHSSVEYNLTTGFRSSVLMPVYRFVYFIPLAVLGFKPVDILFMYAITQIYGILVHTQYVGKLPAWVEYIFVTPSHHRVHHACNVPYLDKNMGMALIIWDRLFNTFAEERPDEPPVFGLLKQEGSITHPIRVVTHEWEAIRKTSTRVPWSLKLKYLLMPPGWSHDGSTQTTKQLQADWATARQG